MRSAALPDIAALLPHSGRMRLLDHVVEHIPERTVCAIDTAASELFAEPDGSVPAWVGLEYMAQCVAAHSGLVARALGVPRERGLLLGTKRTELFVDRFAPGARLVVTSEHLRGERGLVWFDCRVEDDEGTPLARGRLSVYAMPEQEDADVG